MEHRMSHPTRRAYAVTTEVSAKKLKIGVFCGSKQDSLILSFRRKTPISCTMASMTYIPLKLTGHTLAKRAISADRTDDQRH